MAGQRGRKIDPNSVTQRVLAELQDEQWKDTREIALAVGAPVRKVGDVLSSLQGQGIVQNTNRPPMIRVWRISDEL